MNEYSYVGALFIGLGSWSILSYKYIGTIREYYWKIWKPWYSWEHIGSE